MYIIIFYGLAALALLITVGASAYIESSYNKYQKIDTEKKMTGADVARRLLDKHGLQDIKVEQVSGHLSDHYDPKAKAVRLSETIYGKSSIASVAVACHECGHAIQDKNGYTFLRIRRTLVPIVNLCTYAGYLAIIIGSVMSMLGLIWIGIAAEMIILLFQLVTLPVEFDASKRGLREVREEKILNEEELKGGRTMLRSAALTYVASAASAIIEVLRLVMIYGRKND